jgi:hypothetical protein
MDITLVIMMDIIMVLMMVVVEILNTKAKMVLFKVIMDMVDTIQITLIIVMIYIMVLSLQLLQVDFQVCPVSEAGEVWLIMK